MPKYLRIALTILFTCVLCFSLALPVDARPGGGSTSSGRSSSSGSRSSGSSSRSSSSSSRSTSSKSTVGKTASGKPVANARTISRTYIVTGPSYRPAALVGYYNPVVHVYPVATMYYGVPYYPYYLYDDYNDPHTPWRSILIGTVIVCLVLVVLAYVVSASERWP